MAKLFTQEVPEIYDEIEIKGVAREPGSQQKVLFYQMTQVSTLLERASVCVEVVCNCVGELQGKKLKLFLTSRIPQHLL